MGSVFDQLFGGDMKTADAQKAAGKSRVLPAGLGSLVIDGKTAYVRQHGNPEQSRDVLGVAVARMRADKRKGDVVKFLREFRDNPRG